MDLTLCDLVLAKPKAYLKRHLRLFFGLILAVIIVLLFTQHIIWKELVLLNVDSTSLVAYNALVIVAAVYLLTYHLEELRNGVDEVVTGKRKFDKSVTDKPKGREYIEHSAFYTTAVSISILFFIISSIMGIISFHLKIALGLSLLGSIGIMLLLFLTIRVYLKNTVILVNKFKKTRTKTRRIED